MEPTTTQLSVTQQAKDMAFLITIAALIRHHPNRDAVLEALRQSQVRLPGLAPETLPPELAQLWADVVVQMLKGIREAERTLPA